MNIQIMSAVALYFIILFFIAFAFYYKSSKERAFVLGNRSLNYWVTAISAQASDMGVWLFLSYPATIYVLGLSQIWTSVGLVLCMWLNWQVVAPRLRNLTAKYKSVTLWSFFEHRFNDPTSRIRVVSAVIAIFYFVAYIATGFMGIGKLLAANFDITYNMGIALGALLTGSYILIGGFLAAAWCNLFQGLFLLAMIVIVPFAAYNQIGGYTAILTAANIKGVSLHIFQSWHDLIAIFFGAAGWGLGYFGQPHVLINFMGIDDEKNLNKAKFVGITWQCLALGASICVGLTGIALFKELPDAEQLFPLMVKTLFNPFMIGSILCGVLAATLSTVTIQVLVAASSCTEDLYKTFIKPDASAIHLTLITRISIILISCVSLAIAYISHTSINKLVWFAWSGLGASFGPLVLLSLYSKRINRQGALAAIISGGLIAFITPLLHATVPALILGFIVSLGSAYLVSFLTKNKLYMH